MRVNKMFTRFKKFPTLEQLQSIDVGFRSTRWVNVPRFLSVLTVRYLVRKSERKTRSKFMYVSGFN
jgi:hypothetical protein